LEITWHGSTTKQVFKNISANQFLKIKEGNDAPEFLKQKKITWSLPDKLCEPIGMINN
jgi:hypothetical protein